MLNVHPFVPLQAPSSMCCKLVVLCFFVSVMCYVIPGLSGILDFSYIYHVLEKRASIFAYSARNTVKTVFPCSLRSSLGLTKNQDSLNAPFLLLWRSINHRTSMLCRSCSQNFHLWSSCSHRPSIYEKLLVINFHLWRSRSPTNFLRLFECMKSMLHNMKVLWLKIFVNPGLLHLLFSTLKRVT